MTPTLSIHIGQSASENSTRIRISPQLLLAETAVKNVQDAVNLGIEYLVFFRWIFFKNRPRGNFLLIRAFMAICLFGFAYYKIFGRFELMLAGIDFGAGQHQIDRALQPREMGRAYAVGVGTLHGPSCGGDEGDQHQRGAQDQARTDGSAQDALHDAGFHAGRMGVRWSGYAAFHNFM